MDHCIARQRGTARRRGWYIEVGGRMMSIMVRVLYSGVTKLQLWRIMHLGVQVRLLPLVRLHPLLLQNRRCILITTLKTIQKFPALFILWGDLEMGSFMAVGLNSIIEARRWIFCACVEIQLS